VSANGYERQTENRRQAHGKTDAARK